MFEAQPVGKELAQRRFGLWLAARLIVTATPQPALN
jgi:hypothetical protein